MGSFKAPDPDGYQAIFFKSCWHMIGDSVWRLVRHTFATGTFDRSISDTLVALILKVGVSFSLRELHPISLCNVLYKIITKVLVLYLRPCLQEIVGPLVVLSLGEGPLIMLSSSKKWPILCATNDDEVVMFCLS